MLCVGAQAIYQGVYRGDTNRIYRSEIVIHHACKLRTRTVDERYLQRTQQMNASSLGKRLSASNGGWRTK